jgi:hypothetical protein
VSRPIKRILAGAGGLLLGLSTPLLAVPSYAPALEPNRANAYSSQQLSEQQLLQLARAITVKRLWLCFLHSLHNQLLFFSSLGYRTFFCMGCLFLLILPYFLLVSYLFKMTIEVWSALG